MATNDSKFKIARGSGTHEINKTTRYLLLCEDTLSPIIVTICTYPMRGFGIAHGFFKRIHDSSVPRGIQFIALLLTFPCFYANGFFFKCAYCLNHRRLLRLCNKRMGLSDYDLISQLDDCSLHFRDIPHLAQCFNKVCDRLNTLRSSSNTPDIHD